MSRKDFIKCKVKGQKNRKEELFPTFWHWGSVKSLLDSSESCKRPALHAELIIWSSCGLPANPSSHQHIGPSVAAEEWTSNKRRNYFALLIVINRLLLDLLYWGKVIILNTVRNIEWATLIGTEVTFNDCALVESLQKLYVRPDLFLKVPKISVLDQPSPFSLQLSCLLSYFHHLPFNKSRRIPLLPMLVDLPHTILVSF